MAGWLSRSLRAMNDSDDRSLVAACRSFSRAAAMMAVVSGLLVLAGWLFGIDFLKTVLPSGYPMRANAAVCFILCGAALWLMGRELRGAARGIGRVCAVLAVLIGLATLAEYLFGIDLGIDQLLFLEAPGPPKAGLFDAEFGVILMVTPAAAVIVVLIWMNAQALDRADEERERNERELQRLNRALRVVGECNQALLHATEESEFLQTICRNIVETGGHRLAWVGYAESLEGVDRDRPARRHRNAGSHFRATGRDPVVRDPRSRDQAWPRLPVGKRAAELRPRPIPARKGAGAENPEARIAGKETEL